MTWRTATRNRRMAAATVLAVAVFGVVPTGASLADEPTDTEPPATEPAAEPADEAGPETGEVDDATVAVGLPPVPPVADEPQVAVGLPPVPPVADEPQVAVGLPPVPPVADEPQVAVGLPPVPPVADEPQVAVGKPPVPPVPIRKSSPDPVDVSQIPVAPPSLADTVGAAFDLIDDCL